LGVVVHSVDAEGIAEGEDVVTRAEVEALGERCGKLDTSPKGVGFDAKCGGAERSHGWELLLRWRYRNRADQSVDPGGDITCFTEFHSGFH